MIILPPGMVSVKYPGYFYHIPTKKLYSIKSGLLKEVAFSRGFRNHPSGYRVSHNGLRRLLTLDYLKTLNYPKEVEIYPYAYWNF